MKPAVFPNLEGICLDSDDEGSMTLRNNGNTAHFWIAQTSEPPCRLKPFTSARRSVAARSDVYAVSCLETR